MRIGPDCPAAQFSTTYVPPAFYLFFFLARKKGGEQRNMSALRACCRGVAVKYHFVSIPVGSRVN
jgi:hypothetical protein